MASSKDQPHELEVDPQVLDATKKVVSETLLPARPLRAQFGDGTLVRRLDPGITYQVRAGGHGRRLEEGRRGGHEVRRGLFSTA